MVMDKLTNEIRQEIPWTVMCVDDIVICSLVRVAIREQFEANLNRWKQTLGIISGWHARKEKVEVMNIQKTPPHVS